MEWNECVTFGVHLPCVLIFIQFSFIAQKSFGLLFLKLIPRKLTNFLHFFAYLIFSKQARQRKRKQSQKAHINTLLIFVSSEIENQNIVKHVDFDETFAPNAFKSMDKLCRLLIVVTHAEHSTLVIIIKFSIANKHLCNGNLCKQKHQNKLKLTL